MDSNQSSRILGPSDIFTCEKCGKCCKGFGGTVVNQKEIAEISKFLNIDPDQFKQKYCQPSGKKLVLAQREDGYCIFWDQICTIHPVKPHMCKAWPFIKAVVTDVQNWHIMAGFCPGMRTDLPDSVILECVKNVIDKNAE